MALTNPNLVYTIIFEQITTRRVCPQNAAIFLDEFFKKKNKEALLLNVMARKYVRKYEQLRKEISHRAKRVRLLLIDELDALITSKQSLIYNLFDWPC